MIYSEPKSKEQDSIEDEQEEKEVNENKKEGKQTLITDFLQVKTKTKKISDREEERTASETTKIAQATTEEEKQGQVNIYHMLDKVKGGKNKENPL